MRIGYANIAPTAFGAVPSCPTMAAAAVVLQQLPAVHQVERTLRVEARLVGISLMVLVGVCAGDGPSRLWVRDRCLNAGRGRGGADGLSSSARAKEYGMQ